MESTELIKKHKKKFNRTRRMMQFLFILVLGAIIYLKQKIYFDFLNGYGQVFNQLKTEIQ